jgi:hypothetical protein
LNGDFGCLAGVTVVVVVEAKDQGTYDSNESQRHVIEMIAVMCGPRRSRGIGCAFYNMKLFPIGTNFEKVSGPCWHSVRKMQYRGGDRRTRVPGAWRL